MGWAVPRIWEGGECWIIGGGHSINRQFDIDDNIIAGENIGMTPFEEFGDYLSPIHDKKIIGTNMAFRLGPWVSSMIFCDLQFFRAYHKEIHAFHGLKVTDLNNLDPNLSEYGEDILRLRRDNRNGISKNPEVLCWNYTTGMGAINLALLMGAKRIMLLGYDMQRDVDDVRNYRTHWHGSMALYERPSSLNLFKRWEMRYENFSREINQCFPDVEILNVNMDSGLNVWPKVQLKDVL